MERDRQRKGVRKENILFWRSEASAPYVCPQDVFLFIFSLTMLLVTLNFGIIVEWSFGKDEEGNSLTY